MTEGCRWAVLHIVGNAHIDPIWLWTLALPLDGGAPLRLNLLGGAVGGALGLGATVTWQTVSYIGTGAAYRAAPWEAR